MARRQEKMTKPTKPGKRNPVARNPLLKKGGAHSPPRAKDRPGAKSLRDQALDEWDESQGGTFPDDD